MNTNVVITKEEYIEVLGFTIYTFLSNKITNYSGIIGGKRALGEYLENFIYGKIAEIAFKKFLENNYNLKTLIDLDLISFIEGDRLPDIIAVEKNNLWEPLNFWIDLKEVRRDQKWLLLSKSSVYSRPYDAYVAVWIDLPDHHMFSLLSQVADINSLLGKDWSEKAEEVSKIVSNINCEIKGFVLWDDILNVINASENPELEEKLNTDFGENCWHLFKEKEKLYNPINPSQKGTKLNTANVAFYLDKLKNSPEEWEIFADILLKNEKIISSESWKKGIKVPVPSKYEELKLKYKKDKKLRSFCEYILNDQLEIMEKEFGGLEREKSWFSQPLE